LQAFEDAKKHVDLVIVTGGLGPTKDDITKQTFCDFFEDTLVEDQKVIENVKQLFKKYQLNKPLPSALPLPASSALASTIWDNEFDLTPVQPALYSSLYQRYGEPLAKTKLN
jgi:nicotinamide-nucleotide amidase